MKSHKKLIARGFDSRAALERRTAAYFEDLPAKVAAEEADLENALSAASQELDFGQVSLAMQRAFDPDSPPLKG
jgi:hypothetical protein